MTPPSYSFSNNVYRIFAYLRILVGIACGLLPSFEPFSSTFSDLVSAALSIIFISNIAIGALQLVLIKNRLHYHLVLRYAFIIYDGCVYGILAYFGKLQNGYGALLILPVIAGSITLRGLQAYSIPSLVTIGLFSYNGWRYHTGQFNAETLSLSTTLAIITFFVALVCHLAASRIGSAEQTAEDVATDLSNLEKLNQRIIAEMDTGVIAVDSDNRVLHMNETAGQALGLKNRPKLLSHYSTSLDEHLRLWRYDRSHKVSNLRIAGQEWLCQFKPITDHMGLILIYLESASAAQERFREQRLAGLGQLTAAIAHEIRNPLSAIIQASELLQDSDNEQQNQRLSNIINNHGQRLNTIIENVLQLTRHKQSPSEKLDLRNWLHQYQQHIQHIGEHGFEVTISTDEEHIFIRSNQDQLNQILDNLTENARRYGKPPFILNLNINAANYAELSVIDHGLGLMPEIASKAFQPFVTSAAKGTGLGLYICKELAKIHNMDLRYQAPSSDKSFCTFKLSGAIVDI